MCGSPAGSSRPGADTARDGAAPDHASPSDRTVPRDHTVREDSEPPADHVAPNDRSSPPDQAASVDQSAAPDQAAPPPLVDVLTHHNDVARSGANLAETALTTANVSATTFGKLFSLPVDGLIYAQPLYVSRLTMQGTVHNVLIVATSNNSVYAFDADSGGAPLWHASLGPAAPSAALNAKNFPGQVGIASTPAIHVNPDRAGGLIYVTTANAATGDAGGARADAGPADGATSDGSTDGSTGAPTSMMLHVLDLSTGAESPGSPAVIGASVTDAGVDGSTVTFDARLQSQRAALLLVGNRVYLGFASYGDVGAYHGWILAYDYTSPRLTQTAVFNTTPSGLKGGVWQGGGGLVADPDGYVYALTANGTVTASMEAGVNYGEAMLRLTRSLEVTDWFIPRNYATLNEDDSDFGSANPVLLPGTTLIAGGGKGGIVFVQRTTHMGRLNPDANLVEQSFHGGLHMFGGPVLWNGGAGGVTRFYVWGADDVPKEFDFAAGSFNTTPSATATTPPAGNGAGGMLSFSANGTTPGSGIVWGSVPSAAPSFTLVGGTLYALDAVTLATLWSSTGNAARDDFGEWAKFVPPTVVNGKVYMATNSMQVVVYGLLPD